MGILPAAGGSRIWQLCDDRAVRADSVTSFTAYALATDGRLLYAEAIAPASSTRRFRDRSRCGSPTRHTLSTARRC